MYCDFASYVRTQEVQKEYIDRLIKEIEDCPASDTVDTVFIGGGTPSVLSFTEIQRLVCALREKFSFAKECEFTIEVNPGTVDAEKLKGYRSLSINRLSIGLQTCDDIQLKKLGRIHTYQEFETTFRLAREAGFENINVDLMSAIPGQTRLSYSDTLKKVLHFNPEHISAYSLIIEEGTPFAEMELDLPGEDEEREMYYDTKRILAASGYERYEISNYAKKGYECRHNMTYWTGIEYLGLGLGAASYFKGCRYKNTSDMELYLQNATEKIIEEELVLTAEDKMEEYMFLGLRLKKGVSIGLFENLFRVPMDTIYGKEIEKMKTEGLLLQHGDKLRLSKKGTDVANYVMSHFILDK